MMMDRENQLKFLKYFLTYGLFWLEEALKPLSRSNNCFEYSESREERNSKNDFRPL